MTPVDPETQAMWDENDRKEVERDALLEAVILHMAENNESRMTSPRAMDDGPAADLWRGVGDYDIWVYVCAPPDYYDNDPTKVEIKFEITGGIPLPAGLPISVLHKALERFWLIHTLDTFQAHKNWGAYALGDRPSPEEVYQTRKNLAPRPDHLLAYGEGDIRYFASADKLNRRIERRVQEPIYSGKNTPMDGHTYKPNWKKDLVMGDGDQIVFDFWDSISEPIDDSGPEELAAALRVQLRREIRTYLHLLTYLHGKIRHTAIRMDPTRESTLPAVDYNRNSLKFTTLYQPD